MEVENLFDESEETEIKDIELEVTIVDIDDGDDMDKDTNFGDLDPGDDDFESLTFDIPLNVEEEKYKVKVEAEGRDNSIERRVHEARKTFFLDIEKESHELTISKYKLIGPVSCNARTGLDLELINTGSNDEDEVVTECCGANFYEPGFPDSDICTSCGEHSGPMLEEDR